MTSHTLACAALLGALAAAPSTLAAAPPAPAAGMPAKGAPAATAAAAAASRPSRPAAKGCTWRLISDRGLGLAAWVERCDFGARKIDFAVAGTSLVQRWSDAGGSPEAVIDVLPLNPGETADAGLRRIFNAHTDKRTAAQCVLAPYTEGAPAPAGVRRFTFEPDAAYGKRLAAHKPDGVPDPPCGEWGVAPDGIQYFEVQPASGARKVLFVRVGQDQPLFDEATLRLLPP